MGTIKQIGEIQIFAEIYQGATTLVYKGFQPSLERVVLLKVLRPEFSQDEKLSHGFEEEARLIAKIQHPNVVTIYDYGRYEQWIYYAAEFVEGFNLGDLIQKSKFPPELAYYILSEATRGLKAAHDKNILHKDIKPTNILISHQGQIKITDFGMAALDFRAKNEAEVEVKGTVAYLSPEQILGEPVGKHSDIFSLGVTLYEILTGTQAFYGKKIGDYFNSILNHDPVHILSKKTDVPGEMIDICQKMLIKKPENRFQNCEELMRTLSAFQRANKLNVGSSELMTYLNEPESYSTYKFATPVQKSMETSTSKNIKKSLYFGSIAVTFLILGIVTVLLTFNKIVPPKPESKEQNQGTQQSQSAFSEEEFWSQPLQSSVDSMNNREEFRVENRTKVQVKVDEQDMQAQVVTHPETTSSEPHDSETNTVNETGYLQITCNPWAIVFVDGDSTGVTPMKNPIKLSAGRHEIMFTNPDFPEYKTNVEIESEQKARVDFSFWSLVGTLKLEVIPWAEVYIDGEYQDTVPPQDRLFIVLPGTRLLTLKHPSLGSWETTIDVMKGKPLELKFNLRNLLNK